MEVMQRLSWAMPRVAEKLGWAGMLGLIALALSCGIYMLHVLPEAGDTATLQRGNDDAEKHLAKGDQHRPESPSAQLTRFHALLPSVHDLPAVLARVHADAIEHGVELSEGQFKLTSDANSDIARYQLNFPVRAGYAATREFVRAVMQDTPAMALEEMSFERSDPKSNLANTRIQFVLYVLAEDRSPS